ncbi:hypothetical protein FOA52_012104 [Chlamydomonas sp. UWO 241]|nr:hypothetical protein FOA52_012104 [Chlamydomonas sp. UWO 241]
MEPQPCNDQQAHMTNVLEILFQCRSSKALFDSDHPDDARDECIRLLLECGARCAMCADTPAVACTIRDALQLARVPQHLNKAVVGMAIALQQPI